MRRREVALPAITPDVDARVAIVALAPQQNGVPIKVRVKEQRAINRVGDEPQRGKAVRASS